MTATVFSLRQSVSSSGLKNNFPIWKISSSFLPLKYIKLLSHRGKGNLIRISGTEWGLWAVLLVAWDYIKEKWLIAYFHLPTADLCRCNVFRLVHLEMLQNCSLRGFGTVRISLEKPKYLQVGKRRETFRGECSRLNLFVFTDTVGLQMLPWTFT